LEYYIVQYVLSVWHIICLSWIMFNCWNIIFVVFSNYGRTQTTFLNTKQTRTFMVVEWLYSLMCYQKHN
jgi:hypothetical protein